MSSTGQYHDGATSARLTSSPFRVAPTCHLRYHPRHEGRLHQGPHVEVREAPIPPGRKGGPLRRPVILRSQRPPREQSPPPEMTPDFEPLIEKLHRQAITEHPE